MRKHILHILALGAAIALLTPGVASAAPARPPIAPVAYSVTATDSLTTNAIDVLVSLNSAQGEVASLDARIGIVSAEAQEQSATLDAAVRAYEDAQNVYDERVVEMYQAGDYDLVSILLDADTFADLIARIELVTRILESDRTALQELEIVADQARFQSARLEALTTELTALRTVRAQRALSASTAQTTLASLELQLTFDGAAQLDAVRDADLSFRRRWTDSSVPTSVTVPLRAVRVLPYPERYTSSEYHYPRYETRHTKFTASATWRDANYNGAITASGQLFNAADLTCAHPTLPLGTWLAVSRTEPGSEEVRRVIVVVNDRGPYGAGRDLQLSRGAADALGITEVGSGTVACEIVTALR